MGRRMSEEKSPPFGLPDHRYNGLPRPTSRYGFGNLVRVVLVTCIIVQSATLVPSLLNHLSDSDGSRAAHPDSSLANPADEWQDNVFPLRQPTPWDISTDFPYPRTLSFTVEEGTWLRLDVHPKSGEIVFDMLGDLYCLPASSYLSFKNGPTKAEPILLGIPYDSDPHFSPDGTKLLFRSDAELGVENIWISDWTSCSEKSIRPSNVQAGSNLYQALLRRSEEEDMLSSGIRETETRRRNRLAREGRINAYRVTNETYHWVSDARFHPEGNKIIATKWYTSTRSVPAGEGWRFTITEQKEQVEAGSGQRIVGRTLPAGWTAEDYGEQQVGPEMFIWLGDDTVIYSKNVADDQGVYNYDKDVHSGIYAIFTYNLTSGATETLVSSSPGGATRPELSRDKRTLAFVRRVRDKEALVLKDLVTGTIRNIWYGLSYDLAGISAPMGTYPSFSFTPDDDAIIIWAAGKLWHVPLVTNTEGEKVSGEVPKQIPFMAEIEQRLAETRTGRTDILALETASNQRIHAFVELTVDDAGSRVAFQGAGVTYHSSFDSSAKKINPQRVPVLRPESAYFSPSFIPGKKNLLVHTRWSDSNYSTFEIADLSGSNAYELTGLPRGRYTNPVLCGCSGNNRMIAFVKVASDYLTGNLIATANPGLYVGKLALPEESLGHGGLISIGDVRYISPDVNQDASIRFIEGNRKLLIQGGSSTRIIDLASGSDGFGKYNETTIASGRMTTEIRVSPDLQKVAFVDSYNVYMAHKDKSSDALLWSKPGNATEGIARISLDGGHDVQWSADGKRIFWFLGPYLHSLKVSRLSECSSEIKADTSRFGIDCIKKRLDIQELDVVYSTDIARLVGESRALALSQGRRTENADVYAITNANVLTMSTGNLVNDFVANATLVIRKGVIDQIGPRNDIVIPQGATILSAEGGFVVPGFIDVHAHWAGYENKIPARSWEMEAFLSYGVTTMHNPSSDNVRGFVERARVENGMMVGPRIFHTGDVIYGAGWGSLHNDVADLPDAHSALIRIKAEGGPASFSYKNYNQYSRASRQRLLLEARNLSMLCFPEGGMNQDWDMTYIIDGMTTVEHSLPIPQLYEDVLTLYALSGTGATPTHIVNYGGTMGEQFLWAHVDVANDPKLRRFTRHDILESVIETTHRPMDSFQLFNTSASIAKMVRKGLLANVGAHGEPPLGLMYHTELAFTAAGGLTNYEALRAATRDAALTLGLDGSLGSLRPGLLADLVVYPPGVDLLEGAITESRKVRYVMRGGRLWDAETMVEEWPVKGRRRLMPIINAD